LFTELSDSVRRQQDFRSSMTVSGEHALAW